MRYNQNAMILAEKDFFFQIYLGLAWNIYDDINTMKHHKYGTDMVIRQFNNNTNLDFGDEYNFLSGLILYIYSHFSLILFFYLL